MDRRGFTLIEVLVSALILSVVIGAVYGAFRAGNRSAVLMEESADVHQTARVLLGRIDTELRSIYALSGAEGSCLEGTNADSSGNEPYFDKLSFTTVSHEPLGPQSVAGGVCEVTYSAEQGSGGEPMGLYVREDFTPGLHSSDEDVEKLPVVLLSDTVVGMDCTYLDPDTEEWTDEWIDKTALPAAVRVELILKEGEGTVAVSSTTNLPTAAATYGGGDEQ